MVVLENNKTVYLSKAERQMLKEELTILCGSGGTRLGITRNRVGVSYVEVCDNNNKPVGYITGNSAAILITLILEDKCESTPDIQSILSKYCSY